MSDSPAEMIKDVAEANDIEPGSTSVDCLLFVYALTFKESGTILEKNFEAISKTSIELIRQAFEEMHKKFGHLKGEGKLKDKKYSDVEQIRPFMEKALSCLISALSLHDLIKLDPEHPELLLQRRLAILQCSEDLLVCRRHVSEINNRIGWWCKEKKPKDCLNISSAPPSTPTDITKEKKRRIQKPA